MEDHTDQNVTSVNPFLYRGYYYDWETGLYYLNSRYYDPNLGRFINSDDSMFLGANGKVASYNLFAYCNNNPVVFIDSNGKFAMALVAVGTVNWCNPVGWIMWGVAAVTVVVATVTILSSAQQDEIKKAKKKIPNKLMKNGRVDLSKFTNKNGPKGPKGGRGILGPLKWYILKDIDKHRGSVWKLFNKAGKRIASLLSDGTIIGK